MKLAILFILLSSFCFGQIATNQYGTLSGMKLISGVRVTDSKGSANGIIEGVATAPTVNTNGYVSFTGGNGATTGDRGRIRCDSTTFKYSGNSSFSWVVIFRSSKSDANAHTLAAIIYPANGSISIALTTTETIGFYLSNAGGVAQSAVGTSSVCDGKWHIAVLTYNGTVQVDYVDGVVIPVTTAGDLSTTALYSANARFTIGCSKANPDYRYNLTGDIAFFGNYSGVVLTPAQVQDIQNEFLIIE